MSLYYLYFLLFSALRLALPNGSPICAINEARITRAHSINQTDLGYSLLVTPNGQNQATKEWEWKIVIQASPTNSTNSTNSTTRSAAPSSQIGGVLLYIHQIQNPSSHLGKFILGPGQGGKVKFVGRDRCAAANVTSSTDQSTLTHAVPLRLSTLSFIWTANMSELALEALVVSAVIVSSDHSASTAPKWQKLGLFGIPPTIVPNATTSSTSATGVSAATTSTAPPSQPSNYNIGLITSTQSASSPDAYATTVSSATNLTYQYSALLFVIFFVM